MSASKFRNLLPPNHPDRYQPRTERSGPRGRADVADAEGPARSRTPRPTQEELKDVTRAEHEGRRRQATKEL